MKKAPLIVSAKKINDKQISITLTNNEGSPVAFFNRIALINSETGQRILPVFFSDNYISFLPGESKTVTVDFMDKTVAEKNQIQVYGWNVDEQRVNIE
jgi:hypothetical protein